ncbi:DUF2264 domain-containing protein [Sanguibacter suarezii]|uniref:DUF2264 domain-containing protein n=1 Tax=Sanguibacter suarezii TaxID=60921 RepID=UPI000A007DEA|nr:DUF2264 domain-containing protein [Sanguibacter suarezii]
MNPLARHADRAPGADLAPITGWSRDRWAGLADTMLAAVRPFASPGHAQVLLPGRPGGYGSAVDGLEGFARTFLLAGFRLAGEGGRDPDNLAEWFAAGIAAGTDPSSPDRWVRLEEHGQAKVEAASLALILDLTRPWLWDRLAPQVQERVVDYLAAAVGDDTYPRINWVWFRLVVQTFLRSVAGPHSLDEMAQDLATHDTFVRADGWLADGAERSFDHYAGWALHLYPTLWARMAGASDLAAARKDTDLLRLDRFLQDAVELVGADGSPLVQGRSLIYRFAAAAPYWVGAVAGVPSISPGVLRRAASGVVGHFVDHGAPDADGLLTQGWHHMWPRLSQSYSGPGSPYWASKGMLGLALPPEHPVWTATEEPLPLETADRLRVVRAAGWIVSGTRADGIVRVVNHGTDHATEGAQGGDSPLYARLGYSTATSPVLDDAAWRDPLDQAVVLLDADGRASHRTGMTVLGLVVEGDPLDQAQVAVAASRAQVRWLAPAPDQQRHGSGLRGVATPAGTVTTVSLVRGAWEVRLVRVDDADPAAVTLRVSGWPVAGDTPPRAVLDPGRPSVRVSGDSVRSVLVGLQPAGAPGPVTAGSTTSEDASPLGAVAVTPWLAGPVQSNRWWVVGAGLLGDEQAGACSVDVVSPQDAHDPHVDPLGDDVTHVQVRWPDGVRTAVRVPGEATARRPGGVDAPG